ncbi:MAG: diphthamide synthesis protein [Candidatus Woesearchaeota archaeon]
MNNDENSLKKELPKETSILLIPAKYTGETIIPKEILNDIPSRVMLFSSVQFLYKLPEIAKQLEDANKKVLMIKSKNFLYEGLVSEKGQLLGCNSESFDTKNYGDEFDAFLYIGDGIFHPKALLVNNEKDIYCYDPKIYKLEILKKEIHQDIKKRAKGAMLKFLTSTTIGMIITTKRGQNSSKRAKLLKDKILQKWPEKKVFTFICNELNFQELENFNFIDTYINTACSRIGHDDTIRSPKNIINIGDVEKILQESSS